MLRSEAKNAFPSAQLPLLVRAEMASLSQSDPAEAPIAWTSGV